MHIVYCISVEGLRSRVLSNIVCGNAKLDFDVLLHPHTHDGVRRKACSVEETAIQALVNLDCGPFDVKNRGAPPRVFPPLMDLIFIGKSINMLEEKNFFQLSVPRSPTNFGPEIIF